MRKLLSRSAEKDSSNPVLGLNRVGFLTDTANTGFGDARSTVTLTEEDVTTLSPAGTPRVTDDPVRSGCGVVVSFKSNGVIQQGAASGGEDTTGVGLEGELVGLDGDGHRGSLQGVHHVGVDHARSLGRIVGNSGVAGDLSDTLGGNVVASSVHGGVGVISVAHLSVHLQVIPGVVVPASGTSLVTPLSNGGTVNKLLGR